LSFQSENLKNLSKFTFGKIAKEHFFQINKLYTFINHGAFGALLQPIFQESTFWRKECESQPLKFFDRELIPQLAFILRTVAKFINCEPSELLPIQNVTAGLNSVINSINLIKEDEVICLSLTYGSTKKMLLDKCYQTGAKLKIVEIAFPILSKETIINTVANALSNKTRLVVIDHITSNTGLVLPIIELSKLCKQSGAIVVIDAAHALFSQDVSINSRNIASNTFNYNNTASNYNITVNTTNSTSINEPFSNSLSNSINEVVSPALTTPFSSLLPPSITPLTLTTSINEVSLTATTTTECIAYVWITNGHKWLCAPKDAASCGFQKKCFTN
jgi:aspartate carbamoyltransferase regulatory subunit